MKTLINAALICMIILFSANQIKAQSETKSDSVMLIETTDGNDYIGIIIAEDSLQITLSTANIGVIKIPVKSIERIVYVGENKVVGNSVWLENPQAARYFYAPNGYGLKKGEWYYQNIWVMFNQMSVGITNNFSIGVGVVPLFLFGATATPVWITPKFSIPVVENKFNLGVGALAGTVLDLSAEGGGGNFGIVYGVATVGSKDQNASLGIGYGYIDGEVSESPAINFSAMLRGGRNFYFITENYLFIGSELGMISGGGRSMIRNASIDYGLAVPLAEGASFALPWLGFAVPFYSASSKGHK